MIFKSLRPAFFRCAAGLALAALWAGCDGRSPRAAQGYVEGEFVYISSSLGGALQSLSVQRGDQVRAGDPLFVLDNIPEKAARDQAAEELSQSRASLEDAKKGRRPSEIASLKAQLDEAKAVLVLARQDFERQEKLSAMPGGTAQQDVDRARATRDQDIQRAAQLASDLQTAQLGSRDDQIAAAEAGVRALQAALAKADWDLAQKSQTAPRDGLVFDTLYRPGEWVSGGHPVVALLPPENVKVRAFVSEARAGSIHPGEAVSVTVDGLPAPLKGKVSFISPQAEYTPPVIYSQESRGKLVFLIEAVFDRADAVRLHPGQPVDVEFEP
jgi:HlyD family secretion protein